MRVIRASWPGFLGALAGAYALTNAAFAALYLAGGDCINAQDPRSFADAFSFSVQTIATIGYGAMSPTTPWANAVVAIESFVGLLAVALASGMCFAKFSRPDARVGFSSVAVVSDREGRPCLMFRIANERNSRIIDARISVYALVDEVTLEGQRMRRFHPLVLERDRSPVFLMSWLVMHPLDRGSPLVGDDPTRLDPAVRSIVVTLSGVEDTFMSTVHRQHHYQPDDVRFGHRFVDMIGDDNGELTLDHSRLHDTVPPGS